VRVRAGVLRVGRHHHVLPNPQMQPTGRGGPALLAGAVLLVARQWKRSLVRARA